MTDENYKLSELLLPELVEELAKTRKTLERVPDDQRTLKPHAKSRTLLDLCNHLAAVSGLIGTILSIDGAELGGPNDPRPVVNEIGIATVLAAFDELAASSRKALEVTDDARFHDVWQATAGGHVLFSGSRYQALRSFGLNHMMHHRAQLGVYLRLLDVPVPALFGPSADES